MAKYPSTDDLFSIKDRIIVITGGGGRLGKEFSMTALACGARVVSIDLTPVGLCDSELSDFDHVTRRRYLHIQGDVTNRNSMVAALGKITSLWGEVPHGIINNAALDSPPDAPTEENGPFETYPESSWDRVMTVNTKGTFVPCQVFGGAMAEAGRGSIVNISSLYGLISPDQRIYEYRREKGQSFYKPVAYCASKSAILNLTRYLATYWGLKGVRVNTLVFGGVFAKQDKQFLEGYTARVPMGRMANKDEYNGAIVFLLSEASAYMTGSTLVMDGGWTAW
jgi:NAD(P)-dependent dehydrogenase (short-subunit alcohol dehydrogenase family)